MPHVIVAGGPGPQQSGEFFTPQTFRDGEFILALKRPFIALDGSQLALRTVLIEPMLRQAPYFVAAHHEEGIIFKVDPATAQLRTDGVKWAIAVLALEYLQRAAAEHPGVHIARTNLARQIKGIWAGRGGPPSSLVPHCLDTFSEAITPAG
jgi:hypothetical protein